MSSIKQTDKKIREALEDCRLGLKRIQDDLASIVHKLDLMSEKCRKDGEAFSRWFESFLASGPEGERAEPQKADAEGRLARLERQGVVRRATAPMPRELLQQPPPKTRDGSSILELLLEERRSGR